MTLYTNRLRRFGLDDAHEISRFANYCAAAYGVIPQWTTEPMESIYVDLKGRWLAGERDRELALRLMYFSWMHWAEPPFVTGYADDPGAPDLWREAFTYLGDESSTDAEFLYVPGIMAELFPWALGAEIEWEQRGAQLRARAKELQPDGISSGVFDNRGDYGEYFAHQLRGDSFPYLSRSAQE
jgi:hypothetical protein